MSEIAQKKISFDQVSYGSGDGKAKSVFQSQEAGIDLMIDRYRSINSQ
jgi:hypothetical protein